MQKSCILGEDIYYMPGCVHSTLAALMFTNKTRNQVKDDGSEHMSSPAMRKMQMGILTTRLHTPVLSADSDCGGKGPLRSLRSLVRCRGLPLEDRSPSRLNLCHMTQ